MTSNKAYTVYLIIGISTGIVLGSVGVYLYLKSPRETAPLSVKTTKRNEVKKDPERSASRENKKAQEIIVEAQKEVQQSIEQIEKSIANENWDTSHLKDSIVKEVREEVKLSKVETDSITNIVDSIAQDSALPEIILNTEEIIIKQEVLLAQLSCNVILYDSTLFNELKESKNDSLIERTSEVVLQDKYAYTIEYWESPINYRGYKMANNKLVVYGLEPDRENLLVLFEDHLYFRHVFDWYKVEPTFESRSLYQLSDSLIIQQLTNP